MNITRLTELTLGNFQSIKNRTTIPIRPLTILVGPNSAGKSCVYDALDIFELLFVEKSRDDFKLETLLKKYARLEKSNEKGFDPDLFYDTRNIFLGLTIEMNKDEENEDWESSEGSHLIYSFIEPKGKTIIEVEYEAEVGINTFITAFNVKVNGENFVKASTETLPKLTNDQLQLFNKNVSIYESPIVEYFGDPFKTEENSEYRQFEIKKEANCFSMLKLNHYSEDGNVHPDSFIDFDTDHMNRVEYDFLRVYKTIIKCISSHINSAILSSLPKVEASRSIPSVEENIYFFNGKVDEVNYLYGRHLDLAKRTAWTDAQNEYSNIESKINKNTNPHWQWLTYAFTLKKLIELTDYMEKNNQSKYTGDQTLKITEKINYYLSHELFKDTGYVLVANVNVLVPNELDVCNLNYKTGALAKLYLTNANGIKQDFQDVGSGIGYVIPVLCSLLGVGLAKIQQPELHIHPSLQSAIGDVCVDAISNNSIKQIIVETHSEHFILRILRLIRESAKNPLLNQFTADDVSVLYFKPDIESLSTKVMHLRVSEDGSFVDEWPHGFFMERYRDIFDE